MEGSQARAGMSTVMIEPFLSMLLHRVAARCNMLPLKGVKGYAAPMPWPLFCAMHCYLVQTVVCGPGQGISMDRRGRPPQLTGQNGGPVKFGFMITVTDVVALVCQDRAWLQRAATAPPDLGGTKPRVERIQWGPVFHHTNGFIGCLATPFSFTWQPNGAYSGVRAERAMLQCDYFGLDTGGQWCGMGVTKSRKEEEAVACRISLCQHANRLRFGGSIFTLEQCEVIDMYLHALVESMPQTEYEQDLEEDAGDPTMVTPPARSPRPRTKQAEE